MSEKIFLLILTVSIAIIHSCEYEPKDSYERETINDPPAPFIQSVNLDLSADTIYIYSANIFIYDFSSNKEIRTVRFTLDNTEQYIGNSACSSFSFKNGPLTNGIHTLVAELFVSSGTQSIADIIEAEGYLMSKTWILKVNKSYYSQTYASTQDGYLKISWPEYVASDFSEYAIYRLTGYYPATLIKEQTTTEYIDSSYVGEGGLYIVKVNRKDQYELAWGEIYLESEIPDAKVIVKDSNQYFFTWNKSKYYNGVDTFRVMQEISYTYENVKSTQNPNDTSFRITSDLFGDRVDIYLLLVPKKNNINYSESSVNQYITKNDWCHLGYPIKSTQSNNTSKIQQVNSNEFVFVYDDTIVRYSTSVKKIIEERYVKLCGGYYGIEVGVSPLKKNIFTYHYCTNTLFMMNPTNFYESTKYNITSVAPYGSEPLVSDNKIMVTTKAYDSYIYDLNNKELITTYTNSTFAPSFKSISSNADYYILKEDSFRLVKFINPNFEKIWTNPDRYYNPPKFIEFHAINPEQLVYWNGHTFYIKQCSDFSTIYEFELTDQKIFNIDYYNNKMLCHNEGHLLVRSLLNGQLLNDIPVNAYEDFSLINDIIVCENGVMYYLNQ